MPESSTSVWSPPRGSVLPTRRLEDRESDVEAELDIDDDQLLADLEDDPAFSNLLGQERERRMKEMIEEVRQAAQRAQGSTTTTTMGYESWKGELREIKEEKKLIEISSKESFCVIHFFHPDFRRCKIMDEHLELLAPKHPHTLFLRTSVANAPFLVDRLGVKVLPCVIAFVDGNAKDRIVGFEDLGAKDDFPTANLEFRLTKSGVLPGPEYSQSGEARLQAHLRGKNAGSDSEDEAERRPRIRQGGDRPGRGGEEDDDDDW